MKKEELSEKNIEDIRSRFDQVISVVSHIEVHILKKTLTQKNISEGLKVPQRKLWKEALFVQYDKNENSRLLSDLIPIKYLPEGIKVLLSLISPSIKKCDCSDA